MVLGKIVSFICVYSHDTQRVWENERRRKEKRVIRALCVSTEKRKCHRRQPAGLFFISLVDRWSTINRDICQTYHRTSSSLHLLFCFETRSFSSLARRLTKSLAHVSVANADPRLDVACRLENLLHHIQVWLYGGTCAIFADK